MTIDNPLSRQARAALGAATRLNRPDDIAEAKRRLVEANIAGYIERQLATAPALHDDQILRLRQLIGGGAA